MKSWTPPTMDCKIKKWNAFWMVSAKVFIFDYKLIGVVNYLGIKKTWFCHEFQKIPFLWEATEVYVSCACLSS